MDNPRVFDWGAYRQASESKGDIILCGLALTQWHDGHDILEEMDRTEQNRFADGFRAGWLAREVVGKYGSERGMNDD